MKQALRLARALSAAAIAAAVSMQLVPPAGAQYLDDAMRLEPGRTVARVIAVAPDCHRYRVDLREGEYAEVDVDQGALDAEVAAYAPGGQQICWSDVGDNYGPERVLFVAEAAGAYVVEVRATTPRVPAGDYRITLSAVRPAGQPERDRAAAARLFMEGERLRHQNTAEGIQASFAKFEAALPLWRSGGDPRGEADTLYQAANLKSFFRQQAAAAEMLERALALYRRAAHKYGEAATLSALSFVESWRGDNRKALARVEEAYRIFRETGSRIGELGALTSVGQFSTIVGDRRRALDCFERALVISRELEETLREATILHNIGMIRDAYGEKQLALDAFEQSLALRQGHPGREWRYGEGATLAWIGQIYLTLGQPKRAREYFERALVVDEGVRARRGQAADLDGIGRTWVAEGEIERALELMTRALALYRDAQDPRGEAAALASIGSLEESRGRFAEAIARHREALEKGRATADRQIEARSQMLLGRALSASGDRAAALEQLAASLGIYRAIADRPGEAQALYGLALASRDGGDLAGARRYVEEALAIVERLRSGLTNQALRASYFATVQQYFELYIDVLMRMREREPGAGHERAALEASERGSARLLLDSLAEAGADIRRGADPALVERERATRRQLGARAEAQVRLLAGKHTEAQAAEAAAEIETLARELEGIEAKIRAESPQYAALLQSAPLRTAEMQALLGDAVLLEYWLGESRGFVWAVTRDGVVARELPARAEVERAARRTYELLTARNRIVKFETPEERASRVAEADRELPAALTELGGMVYGPVAELVAGRPLLVVADGALQYVPFALLARATEVVSLPSMSSLAAIRREVAGRRPAPNAVAVLADPVFDRADSRVRSRLGLRGAAPRPEVVVASSSSRALEWANRAEAGTTMARLPFTRAEASAILALAPAGRRFGALDFRASRATATNPSLGSYRVVHFATHGLIDAERPELSGLVLSLVDEQGRPLDGFLRMHEVYNLRLPAELVVLSGCRTGLGKEIRGEGLIGLTRGFMYAGAARVLVSLWDVSDEATAELMARFYRGMLGPKKLPPAEALRAAQASMAAEAKWSAPYYWAGFVLQGEPK